MSIKNEQPKVLIVEDTLSMALTYQRHLERAGIPVEITQTGVNAIAMLSSGSISTVLLDLQLPDMNGLEIIKAIKGKKIPVNFIVITANGSSSKPMLAIYKLIETISHSKAPVFITGESGTGKEVCAQAIHQSGPRAKKPFVAINCARADGGTLFLDEICEMDINLQAKLLRFLQTGQIKRVGSDIIEDLDLRILCATNRDPIQEIKEKRFREDLFYRLDVLNIELPPLRDRGDDIIEISDFFIEKFSEEEGKVFTEISSEAQTLLKKHNWPGNVRELQNNKF